MNPKTKTNLWTAVSITVFGIGFGMIAHTIHTTVNLPETNWRAENERLQAQLNHLNRQYWRIKDSLEKECIARDQFMYSLTKDTWQCYDALWSVNQKYQTYVRFHANYDPALVAPDKVYVHGYLKPKW